MQTDGVFAPETEAAAREAYGSVGPAARTVVRETARAMGFDRDEYRDRVTSEVVETARDALFASLFEVNTGEREEFDDWLADRPEYEVVRLGSDDVDRVVWHPVPFAGVVVAATFQNEPDAARATLRRQAFGRVYRDRLAADGGDDA